MGHHLVLTRPKICTDRLVLVPVTRADKEALAGLWRLPDVRRWLWDDRMPEDDEVSETVRQSEESFADHSGGLWKIEDREGNFMGFVGLRPAEWAPGEIELLYGLHPTYWGRGLATEASLAVLRHGFEELGLKKVVAAADSPNDASRRVLERVGMRFDREGELDGFPTRFFSVTP